jgi:short-subunit dehydrogenase
MSGAAERTVVITGAANGLGRELALAFFKRGFRLALLDTDSPALARLKQQLVSGEQLITVHTVDIADESAVAPACKEIIRQHSSIDILVNNAGISISQPFEQTSLPDFRRLIEVNFWGTVYCTRYLLPALRKSPRASIVNVISGFALMGFPGKTAYAASKGAVMAFSNALKTELAGTNVSLSLVIPPPMITNLVTAGPHISEQKRQAEQAFMEHNGMPAQRVAEKVVKQILKGRYRIVVSTKVKAADLLARLFPGMMHYLIGRHKKKLDFI